MRGFLFAMVIAGAVLAGTAQLFNSGYWYAWLYVASACAVSGVALAGLFSQRLRVAAYWAASAGLALMPLLWWNAMSRWPGGDDGTGMGWLFFLEPVSWCAAVLAALAVACRLWRLAD